jgi:hypothetical protein
MLLALTQRWIPRSLKRCRLQVQSRPGRATALPATASQLIVKQLQLGAQLAASKQQSWLHAQML